MAAPGDDAREGAMNKLLAVTLLLAASLSAAVAAVGGVAVKPWERERDCGWWLSREDGHSLRGSIEPGDTGIVLTLANPAFAAWSDEERPRVLLLFNGDPRRRVVANGWSTHGNDGQASFGIELQKRSLGAMAGATGFELHRDGKSIMILPLAKTPSLADLKACIPVPSAHSDSE
jgi:hypothetical protein